MAGVWQKLKNLVSGEEEEAPTSRLEQFDQMVTSNRRVRFIGIGISALCTLLFNVLAIAFIPTIVVKPAPFAVCFTLGNIAAIVMTFFVVGPAKQIKALKEPARLIATIIFVAALIVSVVFADTWVQKGIHTNTGPGNLGQINDHNCGPHSLMQCIYKITGIDMKEATLASWAGTTTSGTGHDGLAKALSTFNSQKGKSLKMSWKSFSSVTVKQIGEWMANPKTAIFFHLLYRDKWGHYELPYKIVSGASDLTIANSLGTRCGEGYYGYLEDRTWAAQKRYISGISQSSVCVISS